MAFGSRGGDYDDEPFLVPRTYGLPELPWEHIAGHLEPITISILRFDARLEASGLAAGWQSRCDMTEAARSLLLDGQLVDIGDLVLHDAGMDVRHPTHELTRAAAALRARRTAMARRPPWPLSIDGLAAPRGIGSPAAEKPSRSRGKRPDPEDEEAYPPYANDADPWKAHLAEIDALLERTSQVLAGETPLPRSRSHLIYDPDQDEDEAGDLRLDEVQRTRP